jgi:hypothetical protein
MSLLAVSLIALSLAICSKFWDFDRSIYVTQKTIELTIPISDRIDLEFIKEFKPAYE